MVTMAQITFYNVKEVGQRNEPTENYHLIQFPFISAELVLILWHTTLLSLFTLTALIQNQNKTKQKSLHSY